jgi:diguanylate cyclase (GGDEF)-like protein
MPDWLTIISQSLLVFLLSFAVLVALTSHLRYQFLTARAAEGLLQRPDATSAFELRISKWLGAAYRSRLPFCVIRIAFLDWPKLCEQHGADAMKQAIECLRDRLRGMIRERDEVLWLQDSEIGILAQAGRAAAASFVPRLLSCVSETPVSLANGATVRLDAIAGVAAYPEDGARSAELFAKAGEALALARAEGEGSGWRCLPDADAGKLESSAAASREANEDTSIDPVTGVLAPDQMEPTLQKFVALRRRADLPVSILVLDIDSMRRYNKQYGQAVGDELLREVAAYLQRNTRESDIIARGHEDQFIIAVDCPPHLAHAVAQRLCAGLRRTSFGSDNLRITATIGTAGWPNHSGHARGLLEEAQIALQVGKSRGRNQCALFDQTMRKVNVASAPTEVF